MSSIQEMLDWVKDLKKVGCNDNTLYRIEHSRLEALENMLKAYETQTATIQEGRMVGLPMPNGSLVYVSFDESRTFHSGIIYGAQLGKYLVDVQDFDRRYVDIELPEDEKGFHWVGDVYSIEEVKEMYKKRLIPHVPDGGRFIWAPLMLGDTVFTFDAHDRIVSASIIQTDLVGSKLIYMYEYFDENDAPIRIPFDTYDLGHTVFYDIKQAEQYAESIGKETKEDV